MKKILRVISVFIIFCTILANLNLVNAIEQENIVDKQTEDIEDEQNNVEEENIPTENERVLPEENEDNRSEDIIYRMDEDGNIFEATDLDLPGLVEEEEDFIQPFSIREQVAVVNFNRGVNAVTNYTEAGTGRAGYTHGQFGADAAYLEHSADGRQVKFMLSDVVGWVDASLVQIVRYDNPNARTLSYYTVNSNGRIVHNISTNINSSSHGTALTVGLANAAPYLRTGVRYYSYDGHYFYDNSDGNGYSRMIADYRNGVRTNSVNPNNPYYNYFQYLPHRSTTNYTAAELNRYLVSRIPNDPQSKMVNTGESFIRSQNTHGVNALLMYGVAINESNWGRSNIAQTRNNLFGHAAIDSNPGGNATGYATVADSIEHHANGFLSRGYLNANDWRYGGGHVGSKGSGVNIQYASDPYWGVKAASQAWVLDLTLGPKDAYKYTLGIKDTINTNHTLATVRNAASSSATGLYTTAAGTTTRAISNYPFILLDQAPQNGFYRIQSNTTLNANRTAINPTGTFNFTRDHVFMPVTNTTIVGQLDTENTVGAETGKGPNESTIRYMANSQNVGWLGEVTELNTAGTTGRNLNLYQMRITMISVPRSTHLSGKIFTSDRGWIEYSNIESDTTVGMEGSPIQIVNFDLNNVPGYRLEYRVHSESHGWQAWTIQGNNAGTSGRNIQAIEFRLIADDSVTVEGPQIYTRGFLRNIGWTQHVPDGESLEGVGSGNALEALHVGIDNVSSYQLSAKVYMQGEGWRTYNNIHGDTTLGSDTEGKMIEGLIFELEGYQLQYRVHLQQLGWQDWTDEGQVAGAIGAGFRIENIQFTILDEEKPIASPSITYRTQVETDGWLPYVRNGQTSGTEGQSKRMETIRLALSNVGPDVYISARVHVQTDGWKTYNNVTASTDIGTVGEGKRLEAMIFEMHNNPGYKLQYRVQVQQLGWQGWADQGNVAGTTGSGLRVEAIQFRIVECDGLQSKPGITYRSYVQQNGWLPYVQEGQTSGTSGEAKRLEALRLSLYNVPEDAYISGDVHVQTDGWLNYSRISELTDVGTLGQSKRLEAVNFKLHNVSGYKLQYRVHAQTHGWLPWTDEGEVAGTIGEAKRVEAIEFRIVKK